MGADNGGFFDRSWDLVSMVLKSLKWDSKSEYEYDYIIWYPADSAPMIPGILQNSHVPRFDPGSQSFCRGGGGGVEGEGERVAHYKGRKSTSSLDSYPKKCNCFCRDCPKTPRPFHNSEPCTNEA